jgi:hypothetical protein
MKMHIAKTYHEIISIFLLLMGKKFAFLLEVSVVDDDLSAVGKKYITHLFEQYTYRSFPLANRVDVVVVVIPPRALSSCSLEAANLARMPLIIEFLFPSLLLLVFMFVLSCTGAEPLCVWAFAVPVSQLLEAAIPVTSLSALAPGEVLLALSRLEEKLLDDDDVGASIVVSSPSA